MVQPIKIRRALYVGLGGTGAKAILRIKQLYIDAYGEVPPIVRFLVIDTDWMIRNICVTSRTGKEIKLSDSEVCFLRTLYPKEIYQSVNEKLRWIPERNIKYLPSCRGNGAGQVRSSGRFILSSNASITEGLIKNKINEIAYSSLEDSKFVVDTNRDGVGFPIEVNLISSAAGGTGSGMYIDILVLLAKMLRRGGMAYSIHPWLVMPDVFRCMCPGPGTALVFQNAYGLIRELDYLYHLPKDNKEPIDLLFDRLYYLDEGIRETYLINNHNANDIYQLHLDDVIDSTARSVFLSSLSEDGLYDVMHYIGQFQYAVKNKEAHYMSGGSAEIIYDNKAVGDVITKGIISQICNELGQPGSFDASKEVNEWAISESVAIQEHDADLLTDSILAKYAPFPVIIDKDSDLNTVNANIFAGADADNVIAEARNNEANKLETVKGELVTKMNEILNSQNGVGAAKAFLESLLDNIASCKERVKREKTILYDFLNYAIDWESEISSLRTSILKLFKKDVAEALQYRINDYIAQKRDLLRHKLAVEFYTDFEAYIMDYLTKINGFKSKLNELEERHTREISIIQKYANTPSEFKVFLHADEVNNFTLPEVSEVSALFRSENPIYELVGMSEKELNDIFFNFAKDQTSAVEAVNVSIEEKMSKLSESQLKEIFAKVKEMSSPMWSTNSHGYLYHAQELTTIFTIGVYDQSAGIIQSNFADEFTIGFNMPTFATTHQTDRITFFQSQCYSPAYAVNNILDYKKDYEDRFTHETYPVAYIDEKWNERMLQEEFDIMPRIIGDSVIHIWVMAIVYGFITYDESLNSYCIESEQGDILAGGLLELGKRRDLAFDQFQLRGLDREVEARIQKMIIEKGRPAVADVIMNVKTQLRTYVANNAQLSPIELDRIQANDPQYQNVRSLLEEEIRYLKDIVFD